MATLAEIIHLSSLMYLNTIKTTIKWAQNMFLSF